MQTYTVKVDDNGDIFWYKEGTDIRHREDGPAIEWTNGNKEYYLDGQRHRVDGPAIEWADGAKSYYLNNKCHRVDGPAIEYANGDKFYYLNGKHYSSEADWQKAVSKLNNSCAGKVVEVNGKKFKLVPVSE